MSRDPQKLPASIEVAKILKLNQQIAQANEMLIRVLEYNLPRMKSHCRVEAVSAVTSVASFVQTLYTKIEELFKYVAKTIDQSVPSGSDWHKELIEQMTLETEYRGKVIRDETADVLHKIRLFRHVVRNNYSEDLRADRVTENANLCVFSVKMLNKDIESFFCPPKESAAPKMR